MTIRGSANPRGEIDRRFVDTTEIREVCGWVPTVSLDDGLARTIEWYRGHPELLGA